MQVKCQICGRKIDRETAYKVEINGSNKYFCSQEEYEVKCEENAKKKRNLEVIAECYQYCTGYAEPPYNVVRKELRDNLSKIDEDTITAFVEENREKLKKTVEKKIERDGQFDRIYFAFRYISGIIKREILEKKWQASNLPKPRESISQIKMTQGDINFYGTAEKHKEYSLKRRPLNQLEDEADGDC